MKIIFIFLLITNTIFAAIMQSNPDNQSEAITEGLLHPGKITLLPTRVNCLEWGDFQGTEILQADAVVSELISDHTYTMEQSGSVAMHWIYIPPFENKQTADREINKLRNLGIVSFLVQDEGVWKNTISLAMLRDKSEARVRLEELKNKGVVTARIDERMVKLQKIVIREPSDRIQAQLQEQMKQFGDTRLTQKKCAHR